MADGNASPAQHERGLLALNIPNARRFLRTGSSMESRSVTVCGLKWKLEVKREEVTIGHGRKKESSSYLGAKISCTAGDAQNLIHVKAKCRLGVRHATKADLEKDWACTLTFDPEEDGGDDDGEVLFEFAGDKRFASIEVCKIEMNVSVLFSLTKLRFHTLISSESTP